MITSVNAEAMDSAVNMVDELTHEVQPGEVFEGTVVRLEDFGAFVELLPNKDGLVHVSQISWERVERPRDVLAIGDRVKVKVREIDQMGRINLTMRELTEKPADWQPPPPSRPRQGGPRDRNDSRGRDRRSDRQPRNRSERR